MNDYTILENLFKDEQDQIHFNLFKESNIIKINYRKYKRALPCIARHNACSHIPGLLKGRM